MNLINLYESSNINAIFDTLEEYTGIDTPAAILLPIRQIRFIELGKGDVIRVEAALITKKRNLRLSLFAPKKRTH